MTVRKERGLSVLLNTVNAKGNRRKEISVLHHSVLHMASCVYSIASARATSVMAKALPSSPHHGKAVSLKLYATTVLYCTVVPGQWSMDNADLGNFCTDRDEVDAQLLHGGTVQYMVGDSNSNYRQIDHTKCFE